MTAAASAQAEAPTPVVLQAGQVIQNYEIIKPLGKGKFSIVYMAKRLSDGLMCALKKINIFDMMVPKQREKCLKEVRLLQSLDHKHIVKMFESIIDTNELLIIVEWSEKGDLKRLIRRAIANELRFKESEIWEYSRQLSSALDHMHKKRIMHRDVKPANIFVSMDGSLKLGDLGLGRFFSSQTLEAFSKVGTPLYMSPEVLHGAGYDMRSDVWSLGCVLYELAMLRSPFKSDQQLSLYDLFVRISKGQYPPLQDTVSAEFRDLVSRMLHLEPSKRWHVYQVLEVCSARIAALAALAVATPKGKAAQSSAAAPPRARPSPLLVMDDIVEKLKLLDCEERLLRPAGFPLLNRCFFAQQVKVPNKHTQFEVMYELIRWLLEMLYARDEQLKRKSQKHRGTETSTNGQPCSSSSKGFTNGTAEEQSTQKAKRRPLPPFDDAQDVAILMHDIVSDLNGRGIEVSSDVALSQLRQGFGEGVCLILNELINQELVGRDFHFEPPAWGANPQCNHAQRAGSITGQCEQIDEIIEEQQDSQGKSETDSASTDPGTDDIDSGEQTARQWQRGDGQLEPIHEAIVDVKTWHEELERVKPLLRLNANTVASKLGWRGSVFQVQSLGQQIQNLNTEIKLSDSIKEYAGTGSTRCQISEHTSTV